MPNTKKIESIYLKEVSITDILLTTVLESGEYTNELRRIAENIATREEEHTNVEA